MTSKTNGALMIQFYIAAGLDVSKWCVEDHLAFWRGYLKEYWRGSL